MSENTDHGQGPPAVKRGNRELGALMMKDILNRLYEAWPAKITISPQETGEAVGIASAEAGVSRDDYFVFSGLLDWLREQDIITPGLGTQDGSLHNVQLTSRGFATLEKPLPGHPEKTLASKMTEVSKSASKQAVAEAAKSIGKEAAEWAGNFVGALAKSYGL